MPRQGREHRVPVDLLIILREGGGSVVQSRVKNLSVAGFLVETPLEIGETVVALFPRLGRSEAQVDGHSGLGQV